MSQFLAIADPGCASLQAFSRTPARKPSSLPDTRLSDRAKILRSIAYMQQHLTERMHISKLAARINVSASYFFALFKRHTGYAPIEFFIHLRMRHACKLLDTTGLSVKEVADQLGYDDAFYFSRLFKSVISLAPTEYRVLPAKVRDEIARQVLPEKILIRGIEWASSRSATLESHRARA